MASEKLIPIADIVKNLRGRREIHYDKIVSEQWASTDGPISLRDALIYIDKFTTGRFFLDPRKVAFENEQDLIMFKLGYQDEN